MRLIEVFTYHIVCNVHQNHTIECWQEGAYEHQGLLRLGLSPQWKTGAVYYQYLVVGGGWWVVGGGWWVVGGGWWVVGGGGSAALRCVALRCVAFELYMLCSCVSG